MLFPAIFFRFTHLNYKSVKTHKKSGSMRNIIPVIILLTSMLQTSCIEKNGYYTGRENSIISLICDITWASKKTTNDEGVSFQDIYKFSNNGTYSRTLITIDKDGIEHQNTINGSWTFFDPSLGVIYFGHNTYWDIDELTEKKFSAYRRNGEFGDPFMVREYFELTSRT